MLLQILRVVCVEVHHLGGVLVVVARDMVKRIHLRCAQLVVALAHRDGRCGGHGGSVV